MNGGLFLTGLKDTSDYDRAVPGTYLVLPH